jgi:hypothetical protein
MIFNNFYKIAKFNKITKFSNCNSLQFRGIVDRRPDVYYTSSKKFNRESLLDILKQPYLEPVHNKPKVPPKVPPPPRDLDPVHNKPLKYNPKKTNE